MSSIAFIGLGNMGAPMALNLVKAGHSLKVYDLAPAAVKTLTDAGAKAARVGRRRRAGRRSRHLDAARQQARGRAVPGRGPAGQDPGQRAGHRVQHHRAGFGPQGGAGRRGARHRHDRRARVGRHRRRGRRHAHLHRRRPARRAGARPSGAGKMGKNIFHAGAAGAGQVAKICNNMLLGILMAGTSEALALGVAMAWIPRCCRTSSPRARPQLGHRTLQPWPGVMEHAPASKGYAGGFGVDLMLRTWAWRPRPRWRRAPRFRWASWRATCIRCTALAARASWISPAS